MPFAWAGLNPGCIPPLALSNASITSWLRVNSFSSVVKGMARVLRSIDSVSTITVPANRAALLPGAASLGRSRKSRESRTRSSGTSEAKSQTGRKDGSPVGCWGGHIHLLISEPEKDNPSVVMQVLKQTVARRLLRRTRKRNAAQGGTLEGSAICGSFLAEALLRFQCVLRSETD